MVTEAAPTGTVGTATCGDGTSWGAGGRGACGVPGLCIGTEAGGHGGAGRPAPGLKDELLLPPAAAPKGAWGGGGAGRTLGPPCMLGAGDSPLPGLPFQPRCHGSTPGSGGYTTGGISNDKPGPLPGGPSGTPGNAPLPSAGPATGPPGPPGPGPPSGAHSQTIQPPPPWCPDRKSVV